MMEEEKKDYIEERPSKKNLMKVRTKRYLAAFVVLMLVCTLISRATASITTPMVTVVTPKRGSLTYKVEGTGVIEASSEIFYPVEPDMKIEDVFVKAGDSVEEGEELFSYDMDALKEKIDDAEEALEASQMAYEKQQLTNSMKQATSDLDTQQTTVERAQEDYDIAVEELKQAKADYKEKVEKIKQQLSKDKQEEYNAANDAYEEAQEEYNSIDETYSDSYQEALSAIETAEKTQTKAIAEANEDLADAQESLKEMTEDRDEITNILNEITYYCNAKDLTGCNNSFDDLCNAYFGKDTYASIVDSLETANWDLAEASSVLQSISSQYQSQLASLLNEVNSYEVGSDEYNDALAKYNSLKATYDSEISTAQKNVNSATKTVATVNRTYSAIYNAYTAYRSYLIIGGADTDAEKIQKLYDTLYDLVVDDTIFDAKAYAKQEKVVAKQQQNVTETTAEQAELVVEAREQANKVKKEWDKKLEKQQKVINEAEEKINELLEKEYSGEDDIKAAWSIVESQQQTVKSAKRSLEDAKESLSSAEAAEALAQANESIQDKIDAIDMETMKKDIEDKTEQLQELNDLYDQGGTVTSTVAGMISNLEVVKLAQVTGSEKVSITPSSTVFTGTFDKDNRKYVEEGATISCKLDTEEKAMDAEIVSIRYDQVNNNYVFTATLPDGNYLPKTGGSYTYTQQSSKYDTTIPLSALRCENNSYYVLVLSETETVLGTEQVAYRVNVEVTSKDTQTAAVTNLYSDMEIITGSSRNIMEGDRVRIGEYE